MASGTDQKPWPIPYSWGDPHWVNNDLDQVDETGVWTWHQVFNAPMPNLRDWLSYRGQNGWENFGRRLLQFFDILLRGHSQMFMADHPIAGLLILGGMITASVQHKTAPYLVGFSLLGCVVSTLTGFMLIHPSKSPEAKNEVMLDPNITRGVCGYDGALVGWAVLLFLQYTDIASIIVAVIFLSMVAAVIRWYFSKVMAPTLPAFSAGFNIAVILYLVATSGGIITRNKLPTNPDQVPTEMSAELFFKALLLGVSQFGFVDTVYGAIFIVVALLISSRRAIVAALMGSALSIIISWWLLLVPRRDQIALGLYSYNAAGASMAIVVLSTSKWPQWRVWIYAAGASMIVTLFQVAVNASLDLFPNKPPVLTIPFLLGTWIAIGGLNSNHPMDTAPAILEEVQLEAGEAITTQRKENDSADGENDDLLVKDY